MLLRVTQINLRPLSRPLAAARGFTYLQGEIPCLIALALFRLQKGEMTRSQLGLILLHSSTLK